ncbi:hypothetical protein FWF48_01500 [Candidatus Saccharibacteria bacterium]|nr:hypothetical protein [Candidatus Saccharibacteria bacterium]
MKVVFTANEICHPSNDTLSLEDIFRVKQTFLAAFSQEINEYCPATCIFDVWSNGQTPQLVNRYNMDYQVAIPRNQLKACDSDIEKAIDDIIARFDFESGMHIRSNGGIVVIEASHGCLLYGFSTCADVSVASINHLLMVVVCTLMHLGVQDTKLLESVSVLRERNPESYNSATDIVLGIINDYPVKDYWLRRRPGSIFFEG